LFLLSQAIEYNLGNLKKWAVSAAAEKAQILAVGELFLCGYNIRPQDREEASVKLEEVLEMVAPIAVENHIALVVPYAEKVEGEDQMYDSMVLIDKEGTLLKNYRKCQVRLYVDSSDLPYAIAHLTFSFKLTV